MIPLGAPVSFLWRGQWLDGVIHDVITFNGRVRHGVRVDGPSDIDPQGCSGGRVYDVWPDIPIIVDVWRPIT